MRAVLAREAVAMIEVPTSPSGQTTTSGFKAAHTKKSGAMILISMNVRCMPTDWDIVTRKADTLRGHVISHGLMLSHIFFDKTSFVTKA